MNSQIEAAQAVIDRLVAEQEKLTQLLRGNEMELRLARLDLEKLQKEAADGPEAFSRVERIGKLWASVGGSEGKMAVVWAKFTSKAKAVEHAQRLAEATKGKYLGIVRKDV